MAGRADLTFHQFRVFDSVVRCGSLSQAALSLDIPQPAVSRVVARIERETGTLLLNRASRGVTLTAAGERFHDNALKAMAYHDLAIEEARAASGVLMGDVVIAAPDSVGGILFAPLVVDIQKNHSDVRLRTIASQSVQIPAMVASGSVDIGIIADTHTQPSGLREPLFREEFYLIGPKTAPVLKKTEVDLSEAGEVPLVLNAMPGGFRSVIDEAFAQLRVTPRVEIEIDANNALLELLVQGAGFSILPYSLLISARGQEALAAARLVNPTLVRTLSLITAPNKPARSMVRETVRRIRQIAKRHAPRAKWQMIDSV